MEIYTIEQRESGTGSIHDIASSDYDREIRFPKGSVYAVVLAAYYGGKGYTTHRSMATAIMSSERLCRRGVSHDIIDVMGNSFD